MTIDTKAPQSRRPLRAAAVTLGLVLGSLAAPALAAPPDTDPWQGDGEGSRSLLDDLLFLVGVPVLVFLVVALLVYLPSMMRRQSTEPALAFRERTEWFGGPRKGVDATDQSTEHAEEKGGASARW
jgi:MFS family permease